ncbi:WD domain, G-beta repeat-containing protein [Besnoitia besnoiti]|uniref:WD domain, G-beta repeat-containing protein n=1 Tax=Besnoitia besnoiti TaxID=94643 RepID=A0A2A9M3T0_BESBE|nr:WD domain, G-beta repeat-containing protein [Besnoitia besnoiti]PFH31874.1 WD domain, G-beta repeat-containing protein [Besnoitia besnoiti]
MEPDQVSSPPCAYSSHSSSSNVSSVLWDLPPSEPETLWRLPPRCPSTVACGSRGCASHPRQFFPPPGLLLHPDLSSDVASSGNSWAADYRKKTFLNASACPWLCAATCGSPSSLCASSALPSEFLTSSAGESSGRACSLADKQRRRDAAVSVSAVEGSEVWAPWLDKSIFRPLSRTNLLLTLQSARRGSILAPAPDPLQLALAARKREEERELEDEKAVRTAGALSGQSNAATARGRRPARGLGVVRMREHMEDEDWEAPLRTGELSGSASRRVGEPAPKGEEGRDVCANGAVLASMVKDEVSAKCDRRRTTLLAADAGEADAAGLWADTGVEAERDKRSRLRVKAERRKCDAESSAEEESRREESQVFFGPHNLIEAPASSPRVSVFAGGRREERQDICVDDSRSTLTATLAESDPLHGVVAGGPTGCLPGFLTIRVSPSACVDSSPALPTRPYMDGLTSRGVRGGRAGGGWARPRASVGGVFQAGLDRFFRDQMLRDDAFSTSVRARGHYGCVNAISFSSDGTILGSGGDDKRVLLWRVREPKRLPVQEIQTKHQENVFGVQFDTSDQYVLTCGNDGLVIRTCLENPKDTVVRNDVDALRREATLPSENRLRLLRIMDAGASFQASFLMAGPQQAIAAMEAGTVETFDFRERDMMGQVVLRAEASVLSVCVHPSQEFLFAYCCCQKAALVSSAAMSVPGLRVQDLRTKKTVSVLKDVRHYERDASDVVPALSTSTGWRGPAGSHAHARARGDRGRTTRREARRRHSSSSASQASCLDASSSSASSSSPSSPSSLSPSSSSSSSERRRPRARRPSRRGRTRAARRVQKLLPVSRAGAPLADERDPTQSTPGASSGLVFSPPACPSSPAPGSVHFASLSPRSPSPPSALSPSCSASSPGCPLWAKIATGGEGAAAGGEAKPRDVPQGQRKVDEGTEDPTSAARPVRRGPAAGGLPPRPAFLPGLPSDGTAPASARRPEAGARTTDARLRRADPSPLFSLKDTERRRRQGEQACTTDRQGSQRKKLRRGIAVSSTIPSVPDTLAPSRMGPAAPSPRGADSAVASSICSSSSSFSALSGANVQTPQLPGGDDEPGAADEQPSSVASGVSPLLWEDDQSQSRSPPGSAAPSVSSAFLSPMEEDEAYAECIDDGDTSGDDFVCTTKGLSTKKERPTNVKAEVFDADSEFGSVEGRLQQAASSRTPGAARQRPASHAAPSDGGMHRQTQAATEEEPPTASAHSPACRVGDGAAAIDHVSSSEVHTAEQDGGGFADEGSGKCKGRDEIDELQPEQIFLDDEKGTRKRSTAARRPKHAKQARRRLAAPETDTDSETVVAPKIQTPTGDAADDDQHGDAQTGRTEGARRDLPGTEYLHHADFEADVLSNTERNELTSRDATRVGRSKVHPEGSPPRGWQLTTSARDEGSDSNDTNASGAIPVASGQRMEGRKRTTAQAQTASAASSSIQKASTGAGYISEPDELKGTAPLLDLGSAAEQMKSGMSGEATRDDGEESEEEGPQRAEGKRRREDASPRRGELPGQRSRAAHRPRGGRETAEKRTGESLASDDSEADETEMAQHVSMRERRHDTDNGSSADEAHAQTVAARRLEMRQLQRLLRRQREAERAEERRERARSRLPATRRRRDRNGDREGDQIVSEDMAEPEGEWTSTASSGELSFSSDEGERRQRTPGRARCRRSSSSSSESPVRLQSSPRARRLPVRSSGVRAVGGRGEDQLEDDEASEGRVSPSQGDDGTDGARSGATRRSRALSREQRGSTEREAGNPGGRAGSCRTSRPDASVSAGEQEEEEDLEQNEQCRSETAVLLSSGGESAGGRREAESRRERLRRRVLRFFQRRARAEGAARETGRPGVKKRTEAEGVKQAVNDIRPLRGAHRVHFSWSGKLMLLILTRKPPLVYATGGQFPLFELRSDGWWNLVTLKAGCFLFDDRHIAIGSEDKRVHVWRLPDVIDFEGHAVHHRTTILHSVYTLSGHLSIVNCCASTPPIGVGRSPPVLATCGIERMVRLWTVGEHAGQLADDCLFYPPDDKYATPESLEDMDVIGHFNRLAVLHRRRFGWGMDSEESDADQDEGDSDALQIRETSHGDEEEDGGSNREDAMHVYARDLSMAVTEQTSGDDEGTSSPENSEDDSNGDDREHASGTEPLWRTASGARSRCMLRTNRGDSEEPAGELTEDAREDETASEAGSRSPDADAECNRAESSGAEPPRTQQEFSPQGRGPLEGCNTGERVSETARAYSEQSSRAEAITTRSDRRRRRLAERMQAAIERAGQDAAEQSRTRAEQRPRPLQPRRAEEHSSDGEPPRVFFRYSVPRRDEFRL